MTGCDGCVVVDVNVDGMIASLVLRVTDVDIMKVCYLVENVVSEFERGFSLLNSK